MKHSLFVAVFLLSACAGQGTKDPGPEPFQVLLDREMSDVLDVRDREYAQLALRITRLPHFRWVSHADPERMVKFQRITLVKDDPDGQCQKFHIGTVPETKLVSGRACQDEAGEWIVQESSVFPLKK